MFSYYDIDVIPIILNRFKVEDIVITGGLDEKTLSLIREYCNDNNASYNLIDFKKHESILGVLPNFKNYSAIFLNDDANWYTVYNELKIIKNNAEVFPLVFICNNNFPNKRRDAYNNPNIIPNEFRQEFSDYVVYQDIIINDGVFHANFENSSKNGVLTAIEDFLKENNSVDMMDIKLLNNMSILYAKDSISQIRINKLSEEIVGHEIKQENLVENNNISNYISNFGIFDNVDEIGKIKEELSENKKVINDYKNKIKLHDDELNLKMSQIDNFSSKLNLKESQIKVMESKLFNQKNKNDELNNELKYLKKAILIKDHNLKRKESNFNFKLNSLENDVFQKEHDEIELNHKIEEIIHQNEIKLNNVKKQNLNQLFKLNSKEYCISCYKEEIANNKTEIEYLKMNSFKKKFFNSLSYIYLIFKSKPKDLSLNLKLYKLLKNSSCFDIGFYLNNNGDVLESKWCKYFSPELHYVCNGFDEKRKFNKKYFNTNSKTELLEYILNCS